LSGISNSICSPGSFLVLRLSAKRVDVFLLHPSGDLCQSVKTGSQSSLQPVYALGTAENRVITGISSVPTFAHQDVIS
jgi:hypothetical protein